MAGNKIQLKRTSVAGRTPTDLDVGELAINLVDTRLFTKNGSGDVIDVLGQSLNTTANVQFTNVVANTISANVITGNINWSYITSKPDLKIDITGDATGTATFTDLANGSIDVVLANTTVTAGTYGNSSVVPIITVDAKGRVTNASTTAVAGITGYSYTAANNTFAITAGDGSTYKASINTANGMAFTGDVTVTGNLTVTGSTTYVNTNVFQVSDEIVTLNADHAGTPTSDVGIEVNRGTSANTALLWNETTDKWTFTNDGTTYYDIPTQAGANSFATIAVSGQTSVVADSITDTLTLANGVGISISTDPVTDTITITNTGTGANSFGTYVFANASAPQPNIVANAAYSTLNMVAGNNVDFSVLSNNTLIISASGTGGGGGGASGALMKAVDSFTGNGSNTEFTLSTAANSSTTFVMVDGLVYQYTDDYVISNTTLTFTSAPLTAENIRVYHFNMVADPGNSLVVDQFVGNGSNTDFTATRVANNVSSFVTVDGILQSYTTDYTFTADLLSFTSAPLTGEIINIHHLIGSHATGFNKIIVSGQANVNATRVESTVIFGAGDGIDITTTSDTVTFSQSAVVKQSLTGNGSNTNFTLSTSTTADNILVFVNGSYQHPDEDYSVSGTTLSFGVAPINTAKIRIRHVR